MPKQKSLSLRPTKRTPAPQRGSPKTSLKHTPKGSTGPGSTTLEKSIRQLYRTGRPAKDIWEFLHRKDDKHKTLSLEDIEALRVERETKKIGGKEIARLPLTKGLTRQIKLLLRDFLPEKILELLHIRGHTELVLEDIAYLDDANAHNEKEEVFTQP